MQAAREASTIMGPDVRGETVGATSAEAGLAGEARRSVGPFRAAYSASCQRRRCPLCVSKYAPGR